MFFSIFGFFWKYIKNIGQKLGSNRCPLFTMLTKQKSSMFCIVSFVKKNLSFYLKKNLSFLFFFFFFIILRSHLVTSFNQNQRMCVTRSTWNPIWRFPLTKATWDPIWRPHSTRTKECVKSGLIVMGNQPRWKECEKMVSLWWVTYPDGKNMKCGLIIMGDLPKKKERVVSL